MSVDVRLGWNCEHVILERMVVAAGQQRLALAGLVGSFSTIQILTAEGSVPPQGLPGAIEVWSRVPGPYAGALTVEGPLGSATVQSQNWDADTAAAALSRQLLPATGCLAVARRGRLGVSGRGRVRATGLGCLGEAVSVTGWPRWWVTESGTEVVLASPVPHPAVIEVIYVSRADWCPRCAGGEVENDARTGPDPKEPVYVQDFDLLVQQSLKRLLTKQGSNPVRPSYGSKLWDLVGAKNVGGAEVEGASETRRVLSDLQQAQRGQARYQALSDAERLNRVVAVRAQVDPKQPTILTIAAEVESAAGGQVVLQAVYAAPGTASRVQGVGGLGLAGRGLL